ncbi:MAG: hypothetical protein KC912_23445 [Proteobacteria bacterium]|nr:hypothetical protein [Pseudomonadota bacterium]
MITVFLVILASAQELGAEDRVHADKQDAFATARCARGELGGCEDLLRAELSTAWARASIAAPKTGLRRVACDAPCEAGPDLPGQSFLAFDGTPSMEVLYAEVADDALRVTLARRNGEAFEILSEGDVDAPALHARLSERASTRPIRAAWWENAPTVDTMVQPFYEPSSSWESTRRVETLTVVCPDALREVKPTLSRVRLGLRGYHTDRVPIYEYELGCEAAMVIGASVQGPVVGPSAGAAHPIPFEVAEEGTATLEGLSITSTARSHRLFQNCTATLDGRVVLETRRSCSVPFAGDLNQDGKVDFVLRLHGEIGCGVRDLWLSSPEGYRRAHTTSIGC